MQKTRFLKILSILLIVVIILLGIKIGLNIFELVTRLK